MIIKSISKMHNFLCHNKNKEKKTIAKLGKNEKGS